MESHPEEDYHREYQTEADDALLGFCLRKLVSLLDWSLVVLILVLRSKNVLVCKAESIVDGDTNNKRCTCYGKSEVI